MLIHGNLSPWNLSIGNGSGGGEAEAQQQQHVEEQIMFYHNFGGCRPGCPAEDLASLFLGHTDHGLFASNEVFLLLEE